MKKRITALLLAVVSILSMLTAPASAAAPDTIKMDDCAYSGTKYDSPALGECYMHQMHFALNGKSTMGFCAEKGKGMGWSLKGHTCPSIEPEANTSASGPGEIPSPSPIPQSKR